MPALGWTKEFCKHGHSMADAFITTRATPPHYTQRLCRTCAAIRADAYRIRRKRDRYVTWLRENFPKMLKETK